MAPHPLIDTEPPAPRLTMRRLAALGAAGLAVFVGLLEVTRYRLHPFLGSVAATLALDALVVAGALLFFAAFFRVLRNMQDQLLRQHQELRALHTAVLGVHGELGVETVLHRVVEQARALLAARYGALTVLDGEDQVQGFVTSGASEADRERVGAGPQGRGLLAVRLQPGQALRVADLGRDPRAVGLPPGHPPMRSLLAVPIVARGGFHGQLYLADRLDGAPFTAAEEATLARFVEKAAIAIDSALTHERLRSLAVSEERMRIAHELHDGMAQVMAYVNTKTQAVKEFVRAGRIEEAAEQLEQLAAAARDVLTDAREEILALRTPMGPENPLSRVLRQYVDHWRDQFGLGAELAIDDELRLDPGVELQILRIVQEALANVRKHARAANVAIELHQNAEWVHLTVADDGVGFKPGRVRTNDGPRFGLATMRERAEGIGGTLVVETHPGSGTRILVRVPSSSAVVVDAVTG